MNTITMYSKQTCSYCVRAERLLRSKGSVSLNKIKVDDNPDELGIMIARTGRRTIPQIFIGDTYVGGFEDLAALNLSGRLDTLLNK